jgi:hypothetical protein
LMIRLIAWLVIALGALVAGTGGFGMVYLIASGTHKLVLAYLPTMVVGFGLLFAGVGLLRDWRWMRFPYLIMGAFCLLQAGVWVWVMVSMLSLDPGWIAAIYGPRTWMEPVFLTAGGVGCYLAYRHLAKLNHRAPRGAETSSDV